MSFRCRPQPLFLLLLLLVLAGSLSGGCAAAGKKPLDPNKEKNSKVTAQMEMNDLNEQAYSYHRHCIGKSEPVNPVFLENMEKTANRLFDVLIAAYRWEPDYTVKQIVERRKFMQGRLDEYYKANGCSSPMAISSKAHYAKYSTTKI